jgi:hypothetical protein
MSEVVTQCTCEPSSCSWTTARTPLSTVYAAVYRFVVHVVVSLAETEVSYGDWVCGVDLLLVITDYIRSVVGKPCASRAALRHMYDQLHIKPRNHMCFRSAVMLLSSAVLSATYVAHKLGCALLTCELMLRSDIANGDDLTLQTASRYLVHTCLAI